MDSVSSCSEEELELLLLIALRRRRKKKKRNMWVRPIFSLRRKQGEYHNLLQKMRMADRKAHFRYMGMSKERFDSLLAEVNIYLPQLASRPSPLIKLARVQCHV